MARLVERHDNTSLSRPQISRHHWPSSTGPPSLATLPDRGQTSHLSSHPRLLPPPGRSLFPPAGARAPAGPATPPPHLNPPVRRPSSVSPPAYSIGPKTYDPLRPEGLYQASKGAKRDYKWQHKHEQHANAHRKARHSPIGSGANRALPPYRSRPLTGPGAALPRRHGAADPRVGVWEKVRAGEGQVRKEQMDAIAVARAEFVRENRIRNSKEWDRKVKRIQLQVFVHARPTPCPWSCCNAVLNSWALLEKHIFHAHLHPQSPDMPDPGKPVKCQWQGCQQVFGTGEECYQHCLAGHMGVYGARCPFNCAYEGTKFEELVAHIGRRHGKATPDDFVPGLIHHYPVDLPPRSALPPLPSGRVVIPRSPDHTPPPSPPLCPLVEPSERPSAKVSTIVRRGCVSADRPLPEMYAERKGAIAAIGAFLENCKRERAVSTPLNVSDLRSTYDPELAQDGEPQEGKKIVMDLIDVTLERKRAEKNARAEVRRLSLSNQYTTPSRSRTGSNGSDRAARLRDSN